MHKLQLFVIIFFNFVTVVVAIPTCVKELSIEERMPEPVPLEFVSKMAPGREHIQEENEQTQLLHDITVNNDIPSLCERIVQDGQNISSIVDDAARYRVILPPYIIFLNHLLTRSASGHTPSSSDDYWLSPFMVAALRGNKELLNCIVETKSQLRSVLLTIKELIFANELALNGYSYPLTRLLQRQDIVEGPWGIAKIFNARPISSDERFIVTYWLGHLPSEPQQLHAHSLLLQFRLSENGLITIISNLITSTARALDIYSIPERQAQNLAPSVIQEIRNRLQLPGSLTLNNLASIIMSPDFKDWLTVFVRSIVPESHFSARYGRQAGLWMDMMN